MIRTFIQATALLLTFEAAIFLARGNIGLSPDTIAQLASTKLSYNTEIINSLASRRDLRPDHDIHAGTATLDGGVSIADTGYADGDRDMKIDEPEASGDFSSRDRICFTDVEFLLAISVGGFQNS